MHDRSQRQSQQLDEEVHRAVLSDGLPVHVIPKPGYQTSFAILAADYGSVDNAFVPAGSAAPQAVPAGIAHFLEHKLFEDEAGDVFDQFAKHGASANAYTYYTETAYHFATGERFEECLGLLLSFVTTPYFTDEAIEKERKVIAQEIRMYEDSADMRAHLELMRCLYHEHPIREDIPGTVESIEAIDRGLLELCHQTFYRPDNMLLVVCGDLDPEHVFRLAEAGSEERARRHPVEGPLARHVPPEPETIRDERSEISMNVSLPRVLVGFKDAPCPPGPARLRHGREVGFLCELLFGRSSAFFEEHCKTGLIDDTFAYSYSTGRSGYAHLVVGGETPDPDGLVGALEDAVARARDRGLPEADFTRLRSKAYGRFLRGFNSVEHVAIGEAESTLQGWDLLGYPDLLQSIDLASVRRRLDLLSPDRRALSVVQPL